MDAAVAASATIFLLGVFVYLISLPIRMLYKRSDEFTLSAFCAYLAVVPLCAVIGGGIAWAGSGPAALMTIGLIIAVAWCAAMAFAIHRKISG